MSGFSRQEIGAGSHIVPILPFCGKSATIYRLNQGVQGKTGGSGKNETRAGG